MVDMAKPWKHPETGVYYLRRQIPAVIREAFGGRQLYKASLGTRDAKDATVLFLHANAELEIRFEQARARYRATGSPLPSSRDRADELVGGYFNGPARHEGGLDGEGRLLLARLEIDRGLWNETPTGCASPGCSDPDEWEHLADNSALFRTHPGTVRHVQNRAPGAIWRFPDQEFRPGARDRQLDRLIEQVARHHGLDRADLPGEMAPALQAYLDAQPVGPDRNRRHHEARGRLRPDLRLLELLAEWEAINKPRPQSVAECRRSADDFIDLIGNIFVDDITHTDLLNFRDMVATLPRAMPRADRAMPLTSRHEKHGGSGAGTSRLVTPTTVKKRVGNIQALLTFAHRQEWIKENVGRDVYINGYKKPTRSSRRTFDEAAMRELFSSPLFTQPSLWSWKNKTRAFSV